MTKLFIEGHEVELTEDVQFLLNKQWEDISDPTTIINDWSKTVTLPGSSNNNRLFGHLYRPDRLTGVGGTGIGVDFDPYKKLDFRLEQGSDVIMQGYAKMNSVSMGADGVKYDITLYGSLGKVFSELQKITFDTSTEDTDYLIHGETYVNAQITKDLVKSCFESEGQSQAGIDPGAGITNFIGFAPNNAMMDDFDYKTYQSSSSMSNLFKDALYSTFQSATGISPENAVGEGLTPRGIGEYRSYQQLPFIYFNKLWRIFQAKAEAITGWTFDLDNRWFNTTNPYWYNVVMMLQNLGTRKAEAAKNNVYELFFTRMLLDAGETYKERDLVVDDYTENVSLYNSTTAKWEFNSRKYVYKAESANKIRIAAVENLTNTPVTWGSSGLQLSLKLGSYDLPICIVTYEGNTQFDQLNIPVHKVSPIPPRNATDIYELPDLTNPGERYVYWDIDINSLNLPRNYQDFQGQGMDLSISAWWYNDVIGISGAGLHNYTKIYVSFNIQDSVVKQTILSVAENTGSYSTFTLNDLWNNDYNPFDVILRYCKMFRIGVYADSSTKTLRFTPIPNYFAEASGTTLDWSDKVDYSRGIQLQPMAMDARYIRLGYDDADTAIGEKYANRYGLQFGDMRVETAYKFNSDVKDLFEGLMSPIESTLQTLSWTTLLNNRVAYTVSPEPFVDCMDSEGKYVDSFGRMFIHTGRRMFEGGEMRGAQISDDTALQRSSGKKFYTQQETGYFVNASYYPLLRCHSGAIFMTFGVPKESYTYGDTIPADSKGIYGWYWQRYMNERYNKDNKILTCYVRLKPQEFASFKHNQLVTIGNQLYFVNKISDYDISANEPTKVELITIQNRQAYYGSN